MSLVLASAALATALLSDCSWDQPGRNPYRGTAAEAVARYDDLAPAVRDALVAKIAGRRTDDVVAITRDSIEGRSAYDPRITQMHFGRQTVCANVTRSRWPAERREAADVYCVDDHCLIVPRICGNVSRVRRLAGSTAQSQGGAAGPVAGGVPQRTAAQADDMVRQRERGADPEHSRVASPDDVAVADGLAGTVAASAPSAPYIAATMGFASPFGSSSWARGRDFAAGPGAETGPASPVPEPSFAWLFGAGFLTLAVLRRRRRPER